MNFIFLTHGLTQANTHLMPWRYIMEIANGLINMGHSVTVVSDGRHIDKSKIDFNAIPVVQVDGPFSNKNSLYSECIGYANPDVIYFPVSRRSVVSCGILNFDSIPHIAYFPSAWYDPKIILPVLREIPRIDALKYAVESLIPGNLLVRALKKKSVCGIATITDYTAKQFIASGWPESRIKAFLPGLDDPLSNNNYKTDIFLQYIQKIDKKKIILFLGPPKAIRGIYSLLKAFDRAASYNDNIMLVCLMRHDNGSEWKKLQGKTKILLNKDKVLIIDDKLSRDDLACFIQASHAVVLPFLLVPSEIPLAVIEALAHGKPVIVSETGGTSGFASQAGIVVYPNNIDSLSQAIQKMTCDNKFYSSLINSTKRAVKLLPAWNILAKQYLDFTTRILNYQ